MESPLTETILGEKASSSTSPWACRGTDPFLNRLRYGWRCKRGRNGGGERASEPLLSHTKPEILFASLYNEPPACPHLQFQGPGKRDVSLHACVVINPKGCVPVLTVCRAQHTPLCPSCCTTQSQGLHSAGYSPPDFAIFLRTYLVEIQNPLPRETRGHRNEPQERGRSNIPCLNHCAIIPPGPENSIHHTPLFLYPIFYHLQNIQGW